MSRKIYKEKQRYLPKTSFIRILLALAFITLIIVVRVSFNPYYTFNINEIMMGFGAVGTLVLLLVFFHNLKIKLALTDQGLEYKMTPFHRSKRLLPWSSIKHIRIIETQSYDVWLKDYNNYLLQDKYTITGRNGISIETSSGRLLFIGSSNISQLEKALSRACRKLDLSAEIRRA